MCEEQSETDSDSTCQGRSRGSQVKQRVCRSQSYNLVQLHLLQAEFLKVVTLSIRKTREAHQAESCSSNNSVI